MELLDIVPLPEAMELKKLGCPDHSNGQFTIGIILFSSAFRWFRKKHKLVHEINSYVEKWGIVYDYEVFSLELPKDAPFDDEEDGDMQTWETLVEKDLMHVESISYEAAELECLKWLIKYVKENKS